jgi:microsomal dipeptidase-like Zn-dependent dipeptidase
VNTGTTLAARQVGDVNGDGFTDMGFLMDADGGQRLWVFASDPVAPSPIPYVDMPLLVADTNTAQWGGDIDGDGAFDLISEADGGTVLLATGERLVLDRHPDSGRVQQMQPVGDLDGDGLHDIVLLSGDLVRDDAWLEVHLLRRPGPSERVAAQEMSSTFSAEGLEVLGDRDGDGVDAVGAPGQTTWPDGDVYGIVDMHSHLLSNFAFAGALFHGSPFHRLGVPHALHDCSVVHGENGRVDFFGYAYDAGGNDVDLAALIPNMLAGELSADNHATAGYPDFTEWPDSRKRSTHQTQYHRWLERAWLGGLRLVVQHATSNAVNCNIAVGEGWTRARYDCEDMTAVDRQLDAVYEMERYLDAQAGGPGLGWFRIVTTPAEAREVIEDGKMAVILGIEVSDLFNCHLTPRPGGPVCDEAHVEAQLDAYMDRGVRALFPNHKYDNAFTPGDGSDSFIEAGNFLNSGYYTNKVTDCPTGFAAGFDHGEVSLGGLLEPREEYQSTPPNDFSGLADAPIATMLPHVAEFLEGPVEGDFCQNGTLTDVGETLIAGIMARGLLLEVDHLPRWSYVRAFELLEAADYPALGTHGRDYNGKLYETGGLSTGDVGRCRNPDQPGATWAGRRSRLEQMTAAGMHPSLGFGFDYNGFAGGPGPRFGPDGCATPQDDPITYPFTSVDGAVTFEQPVAGNRSFDFNQEGMAHMGLLPELIEDARRDGATDEDLEALFRSAEGYLRMWERAQARGAALRGE